MLQFNKKTICETKHFNEKFITVNQLAKEANKLLPKGCPERITGQDIKEDIDMECDYQLFPWDENMGAKVCAFFPIDKQMVEVVAWRAEDFDGLTEQEPWDKWLLSVEQLVDRLEREGISLCCEQ